MKKLLDLRFVIGMFFIIVGALLEIYYLSGANSGNPDNYVNAWCGAIFLIFGVSMVLLSRKKLPGEE
jgi:hypothetical protein